MTYYAQLELDKVLHRTFFPNKRDGFFVECGAYDGLDECTCKFFEETMGWKGLNIEPVPYTFDRLVKNRPNAINEKYALSSADGKATFRNVIHPTRGKLLGCGTLLQSQSQKYLDIGYELDIFEVETIRFSELYKKHSLPDIDLFVLDVEGNEEEALKCILTIPTHALPKVFCIEMVMSDDNPVAKMLIPHYDYHSSSFHNVFFTKKIKQ